MTVSSVAETEPRALPVLDDTGRAILFTHARTANSFAPTPPSDYAELEGVWQLAKLVLPIAA